MPVPSTLPKLLELSGIEILEHLGIPLVVKNQHVRKNMQNHVMCLLNLELNEDVKSRRRHSLDGDGANSSFDDARLTKIIVMVHQIAQKR